MAAITYSPDSLVCTVRTTLVAGLVSVIVTPGTASPLVSTTVPLISPDGVWPRTGTAIETRRRRRIPERRRCMRPPQRAELASKSRKLARQCISGRPIAAGKPARSVRLQADRDHGLAKARLKPDTTYDGLLVARCELLVAPRLISGSRLSN